jgi:hypothetical protein
MQGKSTVASRETLLLNIRRLPVKDELAGLLLLLLNPDVQPAVGCLQFL